MFPIVLRSLRLAVLGGFAVPLMAAPATMLFTCLSAKIEPATLNSGGQHRLSFNYSNQATENGELGILPDDLISDTFRGTGFHLTAPGFGVPIEGFMYLDTPQTDANHNGVDDVFEVAQSQPVVSTSGTIDFKTLADEQVKGTVVAQWQRPAGVTRGTVQIALSFPGYNRTFNHNFEVFHYRGTLDYARHGTNVDAAVKLTREGAAGTLAGSWPMHVQSFDSLAQDGGAWVEGKPKIKLDPTVTDKDGTFYELKRGGLGTNYFGVFKYSEGSPIDDIPLDYGLWEIDVFDPNDADGDHLPDLTDPGAIGTTPPAAPQISVVLEASAPRLRLSGTPGANYVIEQKDTLTAVSWVPASTNQPTANGTADIPLSTKGSNGVRFWRARVL